MEYDLRKVALYGLKQFAELQGVPLVSPNVAPDDRPTGTHLRWSLLPVEPQELTTCGGARYNWIIQVSVYCRDDSGEGALSRMADSIRCAFPIMHKFVGELATYQVVRTPAVRPPVSADGWYFVPVQLRVQTIH